MTRRTGVVMVLAFVGALALILASVGAADHGKGKKNGWGKGKSVEAKLTGYEEVPSVSSPTARGKIKLKIKNSTSIDFKLSYSGLSSDAQQAHIHFGQWGVNGGVSAFLCGGAKPACPAGTVTKATVEGTIVAADVLQTNVPGTTQSQGIAPGEIAELIAAIKAGVAYANVHTTLFPGGEIRGQLDRGKKRDD
jgi:CHRD domain